MFEIAIGAAAFLAGAIASVAGFGIGSILTPLLSLHAGTRLAVAAISIPHFLATLLRFWLLRRDVDTRVLLHIGILSAAGGLAGALLHTVASNPALTFIFAALLIFAGVAGLTGYTRRMRFGPRMAWIAGGLSGLLGGLVGNQGASARLRCSASASTGTLSSLPQPPPASLSTPPGCPSTSPRPPPNCCRSPV